jgi:hypothetical protein
MAVIKIHRIVDGPFDDDDDLWYNICLVEMPDGRIENAQIDYPDFDDAYNDIKKLNSSIYPIEVEVEDVERCLTSSLN